MSTGDQLCKLPGCENKAYVQNNGTIEDYCGHTHAIMHRDFLTEAQSEFNTIKLLSQLIRVSSCEFFVSYTHAQALKGQGRRTTGVKCY